MSDREKKTDQELYQTLSDTERLLSCAQPEEGKTYSLDSILAEFGTKTVGVPEDIPSIPPDKPIPQPVLTTPASDMSAEGEPPAEELPPVDDAAFEEEPEEPVSPRRHTAFPEEPEGNEHEVPLEQVMSRTVESVLEEDEDEVLRQDHPLRRFFRRHHQETEELYENPEKTAPVEPEPEIEEPDMDTADRRAKEECKNRHRLLLPAGIVTALLVVMTVLDYFSFLPAIWRESAMIAPLALGALLLIVAALCANVWGDAIREMREHHRIGVEFCAALACVVTLADCALAALSVTGRCSVLPLAAPCGAVLFFASLGRFLACGAQREAFHLLSLGGEEPYAVAATAAGVEKQRGTVRGFYNTFEENNTLSPCRRWQKLVLPVLLTASLVLGVVVGLVQHTPANMPWCVSLLMLVSTGIALPLTDTLPVARLIHRLNRSGCAVAGYCGARQTGKSRQMVLTDSDLFPPGTVGLNGLKIYGEEIGRVVSYAATLAKASNSQLSPLFEQLLASEGGMLLHLDGLNYYEEGGVSGTIHGETVLLGTAYFMKKMRVSLPTGLKLKTAAFLAVDGHLTAIFAVKYQPSRNVEWALRAMKRNHFHPVLAVRDGNITPGLLKRKFGIETHPIYPDISTRLALAEEQENRSDRGVALIYREGLMPFAETVIGSRRCCAAARIATILAFLGSVCGLLLGYYMLWSARFALLSPFQLLVFLLLWLIPTLLLSGWVRHY
jgi:hypothetical protein